MNDEQRNQEIAAGAEVIKAAIRQMADRHCFEELSFHLVRPDPESDHEPQVSFEGTLFEA